MSRDTPNSQFLLTIDTECTDEARRKRYIKVLNENAKQFEKNWSTLQ